MSKGTCTPEASPSSGALSRCLSRSASRRANRCRFYRNGDIHYGGYQLPVSLERYGNIENLYNELTSQLASSSLPSGVRAIYSLKGEEITSLTEICQSGGSFVAAGKEPFKSCDYLQIFSSCSRPKNPRARALFKSMSTSLSPSQKNLHSPMPSSEFVRPRIIFILSHGNRPRKVCRFVLNKKTAHSLEDVKDKISETVDFAVRKLVAVPTGMMVTKLEDLFDTAYTFIACPSLRSKIIPRDLKLHKDEIKALPNRHSNAQSRVQRKSSLREFKTGSLTRHNSEYGSFMWPKSIRAQFMMGEKLGDGHFAEVRRAVDKRNHEEVAVKVIDIKNLKVAEQEIKIMKRIVHPNVVRLLEEHQTKHHIYLILELITGGDLYDFITQSEVHCQEQACQFTYNLANALHYLHSFRIVHRDIKPENLLVHYYPDGSKRLKLCDFGLATVKSKYEKLVQLCGTPTYAAPEMITGRGYDEGVDVWALGVITYIMLCGFSPFISESGSEEELFHIIMNGSFEFPSPYWDDVEMDAQDFIIITMQKDCDRRPTAGDLLNHKWLDRCG